METIYVTGHRNPDLDSVCSAWCYARLKNKIDKRYKYEPVRIGHLNETTKHHFRKTRVMPPRFIKDVRAKVRDVVIDSFPSLHPEDPVYSLVTLMREKHASVVPLLDGSDYFGLLSLDEITAFFLKENAGERPHYNFQPENFSKVIRGEFLKKNNMQSFEAYIMTGAMEFDIYRRRLNSLLPDLPVLVVGKRLKHIQYGLDNQFPAIILTGIEPSETLDLDLKGYKGIIYKSYEDTAETIRLLRMSLPLKRLVVKDPPKVSLDDLFDDAKRLLMGSEYRGLPVFDNEKFVGFITRRCFLEKPRKKVIMVDHNELSQSIEGLEEADIIEIIDHHRLDAERTRKAIFIASEPVGSTCTIVYHQYLRWSVRVDRLTALILLAGIISDTVILKSPTTTPQDLRAVNKLAKIAKIENIYEFGEELFSVASLLNKADPRQVIEGDFKTYQEGETHFGIGQVEVTTLTKVDEVKEKYIRQLEATKQRFGLDWAMLLVTDVIAESSILLTTSYPKKERALLYPMEGKGKYLLKGVLSRKKQLLPEVISVLEEGD